VFEATPSTTTNTASPWSPVKQAVESDVALAPASNRRVATSTPEKLHVYVALWDAKFHRRTPYQRHDPHAPSPPSIPVSYSSTDGEGGGGGEVIPAAVAATLGPTALIERTEMFHASL
jgi:hypothetical protein